MTECCIEVEDDTALCRCDNCGHEEAAGDLDMVTDIQERITPGYEVPAGQCTECGALSYLIVKPEWSPAHKAAKADEFEIALRSIAAVPGNSNSDPDVMAAALDAISEIANKVLPPTDG